MRTVLNSLLGVLILFTFVSCGIYSFTGGNTGDAKTIQIDLFKNEAPIVEPTLSPKFTESLRDLFTRQTNLTLTNSQGDLTFEGEIVDYRITPMSATANQRAAQNRLTIVINVRFTNRLEEKDNFERKFSFYADFDAGQNPQGAVLEGLVDTIFERITQDIFNASVAKW